MIRRALLPAFVALSAVMATAPARAAFVTEFSGNTQPYHTVPGPGVGGTVNFAVLDRTGGTPGDTFGTGIANFDALFVAAAGSGALDTSAQYLYLYQTVNNGPSAAAFPISTNTVAVTPGFLTSFGTFTGTSFSTTVVGVPAGFSDPSAVQTGASPSIVSGQNGLGTPTVILGETSLRALFNPELMAGGKSILWGYTSDRRPDIGQTGLIDGGTTSNGRVPTATFPPVPEPSAVVLSLIGLPIGLLLRRRAARV